MGVVGRTGAGKSSIMAALFRLVKPPAGLVLVNGVDTAHLGLRRLRSGLSIIPQVRCAAQPQPQPQPSLLRLPTLWKDPVLWSCSVRDNLDPFGKASDDKVGSFRNGRGKCL